MSESTITTHHLDGDTPVVLSVPHGGTHLPAWCTAGLGVLPEDLWSDWGTAELYDLADELPIAAVITGLSRFVADPNRAPVAPLHGDFWSTPVPACDPAGVGLYDRDLPEEALRARLELAHVPYHRALDRAVESALRQHRRIVLLDLHSFGLPLGVDVVLGDGAGRTADAAATGRVEQALTGAGFTVARNLRFSGGYITHRWADDDRVDAVQLELNQRRYLCAEDLDARRPRPRRDPTGWQETRRLMTGVLDALAAAR